MKKLASLSLLLSLVWTGANAQTIFFVHDFGLRLADYDVELFYYAGHGIQVSKI
ncbi:MAG: hypothetical protein ACQERS_04010 [Bacteroidota bacterium]